MGYVGYHPVRAENTMQKRQRSLESQLVGWFSLHLVFDLFLEIVDELLQAKSCKSRGQHFVSTVALEITAWEAPYPDHSRARCATVPGGYHGELVAHADEPCQPSGGR